ncbi:phosphonate metabolism transcriptional regulator PhnF [Allorhizobium terrae]|uniref:Phosphonate metabolism transcriptional regulator PhnF n=1 Tax=Allorhizobium terrae TaxID=1848972 RepID=A0A4V6RWS3_9HYPH|nr:phosphonate metabolism transcriptional regulator PhnF [Allorhizobium terrae]THF48996.1 phosphonate metabolism transcriptional regulator PhnF [Allorhizobium terrae]TWD55728.1 GntR family phosphonate transport system transcriptional regulator [Agrobacterium vitis]
MTGSKSLPHQTSPKQAIQRQTGVALWRQIADRIRVAISDGLYDATGMVPPEAVLAAEFEVNRHTVRSALAALAQEGIVRAVQGRGTLIERRDRITFPISKRTRFTPGIGDQARILEGLLLESAEEPATAELAAHLKLKPGEKVIRMEGLRKADGQPVSRATSWFPAKRFAGIDDAYRKTGSVTAAFAACGLADYLRIKTEVSAVHADPSDRQELGLSPGAIVLVTKALNADPEGIPVQYAVTRFPADRVQFTIET